MKKYNLIVFFFSLFFILNVSNDKVFAQPLTATQNTTTIVNTDYGSFTYKQADLISIDSTCTNGYVFITDSGTQNELYIYFFKGDGISFDIEDNNLIIKNISPLYRYYKRFRYDMTTNTYTRINNQNNVNGSLNLTISDTIFASFNNYVYQPFGLLVFPEEQLQPYDIYVIKYNTSPYEIQTIPLLYQTLSNDRVPTNWQKIYQLTENYSLVYNDYMNYKKYSNYILYDIQRDPYYFYANNGECAGTGFINTKVYYNTTDNKFYKVGTNTLQNSCIFPRSTSNFDFNYDVLDQNGEVVFPASFINTVPFDTKIEVSKYNTGQYGFVSNRIIIDSITSSKIDCPINTPFEDDYCFTSYKNYSSNYDLLNDTLILQFDLNEEVNFKSNQYYIFTFRVNTPVNILPQSINIQSGGSTRTAQIISTNVYNNSGYTDYQLVVYPNSSDNNSNIDIYVSRVDIIMKNLSNYEFFAPNFRFGVYNHYKWTDASNVLPDSDSLEKDYKTNNIESIGSSNNSWFSNFNINTHGLSSFITAPIRLFQSMRDSTCSSVVLPVPHFGNIQLPCIKSIFEENMPDLLNIYQLIMSGIICYYIGLNYFRIIKNAFNPEDDRIEVQDL